MKEGTLITYRRYENFEIKYSLLKGTNLATQKKSFLFNVTCSLFCIQCFAEMMLGFR